VAQSTLPTTGAPAPTNLVLADLLAAREYVTPAIALCLELDQKALAKPADVIQHKARIEAAIAKTEQEIKESAQTLRVLIQSAPVPAAFVPAGF
jgi:hypothetical protein